MNDSIDRCGYGVLSTGEGDPFEQACINHDAHYVLKDCTLEEADRQFIREMRNRIEHEQRWYRRAVLVARASLYAAIVSALGWVFWNT